MKKLLCVCAAVSCAALLCSCGEGGEPEVTRPSRVTGETYTIPRTDVSSERFALSAGNAVDGGFTCADITGKILENVNMSSMAEVGADRIGMYIDCDIPEDTDFSFYICGSGGFADEICVINVNGVDTDEFTNAVNSRIESRMNDFRDYNPDEYQKLTEMFTKQTGDILIYAVTGDNAMCEEIFDEFAG
ncbi:MAG: DUF4358 domain-containing protein [Ruminococcus sp.]|nr:DUF4358 domain-containing protein [Ruminococcus sp.]